MLGEHSLMELVIALLTAFFLWLWIYDGSRRAFARSRLEAGKLICKAARRGQEYRYLMAAFFSLLLGFHLFFGTLIEIEVSFLAALNISLFTFVILESLFPPAYYAIAFEVHEKGLVARGLFAPWSKIHYAVRYCSNKLFSWYSPKGRWVFFFRNFSKEFSVSTLRQEDLMETLGQFIDIRDENGTFLVNPQKKIEPSNDADQPADLRRTRFQFDLRSLLLFFIFAASLSSQAGIHYHRWDRQRIAVQKLQVFKPKVDWLSSNVWELSFSQSDSKPTDDDLPELLNFPDLRWLDLSGAPITDVGLEHLAALRRVQTINLTNTKITKQGFEKLKMSLPDATITWSPPNNPPSPVPTTTP
jgi:hypothetical protein